MEILICVGATIAGVLVGWYLHGAFMYSGIGRTLAGLSRDEFEEREAWFLLRILENQVALMGRWEILKRCVRIVILRRPW